MPPKKVQQKVDKKSDQKKKERIIEDKTFGIKNKKGGKQQRYIKNVNQQVKCGGTPSARKQDQINEEERKKKDEKKKTLSEIDALFKPVMVQSKLGKGADPKSVLCAFHKQGMCHKGAKCKFSHDLTIERKSEKRSMYFDERADELNADTMDTWDESKLQEVVEKKHGVTNQTKTEKVCKFFLQAIEDRKYGWFWTCPNGGPECMYRHALPPGFILKSEKKKMDEQKEKISIEDLIERERAALGPNVTKITLTTFLAWKKKKQSEKIKAMYAEKEQRKNDARMGKQFDISGREMFEFNPDMVGEDDADADADYTSFTRYGDDNDISQSVKNITINQFTPTDVEHGTENKLSGNGKELNHKDINSPNELSDAAAAAKVLDDVPVDEDLFTEDLDDLDDDMDME